MLSTTAEYDNSWHQLKIMAITVGIHPKGVLKCPSNITLRIYGLNQPLGKSNFKGILGNMRSFYLYIKDL